jgi:hypothetical protein
VSEKLYEEAVKTAFTQKPLRNVLLIDDQFPTLADLAVGETEATKRRFKQKDTAVKLYQAFRSRAMTCDVVNVAEEVHQDLLCKSDLIVLDYHLGDDDHDPSKSIDILRDLARSKHFNNVVVYTAETDLDAAWLMIIASLAGGWSKLPAELEGDAKLHWDRLDDEGKLPKISKDAVMQFARKRDIRVLDKGLSQFHRKELTDLAVPAAVCSDVIKALIHRELADMTPRHASVPGSNAVGDFGDGKRWVHCGNTFITVVQKKDPLPEGADDPAGILKALDSAVLAWRPNLVQIIVAEIQNVLELDALLDDNDLLGKPETQAALIYYLMDLLGPVDTASDPDIRPGLTALVDRIVEGVRRRVSTNDSLLSVAKKAVMGELIAGGWKAGAWPKEQKLVDGAMGLARTPDVKRPDMFFRLNSFLGAEPFSRAHITTGTVVKHRQSGDCFAIASPACDMVPRQPSAEQHWLSAIHNLKSVVCIRLTVEDSHDGALADAAHGRHIFLESNSDRSVYRLWEGNAPSYEIIFVEQGGLVRDDAGKTVFSGKRIRRAGGAAAAQHYEWNAETFEIIGQVRSANASRIMQLATQHMSRIGLDYLTMPSK